MCDLIPGDWVAGAHFFLMDQPPGLTASPDLEQKERGSFPTSMTVPLQTDGSSGFRGPPRRTLVAACSSSINTGVSVCPEEVLTFCAASSRPRDTERKATLYQKSGQRPHGCLMGCRLPNPVRNLLVPWKFCQDISLVLGRDTFGAKLS